MTNRRLSNNQDEAALEWLVRLNDDEIERSDRDAFQAWLEADPRNREAFRKAEELWDALDRIGSRTRTAKELRSSAIVRSTRRSSGGRRLAALAALMMFAGVGWHLAAWTGAFAEHSTLAGQQSRVVFADGSEALLNTSTSISTEWSSRMRSVVLHRGEAFFSVAEDAARPFVVIADNFEVEALGTQFSVRMLADGADIIVMEHSVAVASEDTGAEKIDAPGGLHLSGSASVPIAKDEVDRLLAWRNGRVVFEDEPLLHVLNELDRYLPGEILLASPSIEELPVSASFEVENAERALDAIEASLPVSVRRIGSMLFVITAE